LKRADEVEVKDRGERGVRRREEGRKGRRKDRRLGSGEVKHQG